MLAEGEKVKRPFSRFYFCTAPRRSEKLERKDFPSGPAKRVRRGGLEWKGLPTSAGV